MDMDMQHHVHVHVPMYMLLTCTCVARTVAANLGGPSECGAPRPGWGWVETGPRALCEPWAWCPARARPKRTHACDRRAHTRSPRAARAPTRSPSGSGCCPSLFILYLILLNPLNGMAVAAMSARPRAGSRQPRGCTTSRRPVRSRPRHATLHTTSQVSTHIRIS